MSVPCDDDLPMTLPIGGSIPADLFDTISNLWKRKYADFYETPSHDEDTYLERVLPSLVSCLVGNSAELGRRRCILVILALALASRPMIARNRPSDDRPEQVLSSVRMWLDRERAANSEVIESFRDLDEVVYPESVGEALTIFRNLQLILESADYQSLTAETVELALSGDSIARCDLKDRGLFRWFLFEVVPNAFNLELPTAMYPNHAS